MVLRVFFRNAGNVDLMKEPRPDFGQQLRRTLLRTWSADEQSICRETEIDEADCNEYDAQTDFSRF